MKKIILFIICFFPSLIFGSNDENIVYSNIEIIICRGDDLKQYNSGALCKIIEDRGDYYIVELDGYVISINKSDTKK